MKIFFFVLSLILNYLLIREIFQYEKGSTKGLPKTASGATPGYDEDISEVYSYYYSSYKNLA